MELYNMGLDAFATVVYSTQDDTNDVTEQPQHSSNLDNNNTPTNEADFAYWRNFDHLQYWMEQLFYQKGGTDENDFNGDYVELSLIDLEKLWQEANLDQLNLLYNTLFKEKDYSHYQLQVIKRSDLEELQRKFDSEAAKQAAKPRQSSEKTKKNREKYLIGLYNKKRIGIQYYYRDQNDFIYICQNSNIERSCQRHYL